MLTAVDAAVMVIDAAKGVEERTIKLLEVCRLRATPIITFVNKMDREVREPFDLQEEIESRARHRLRAGDLARRHGQALPRRLRPPAATASSASTPGEERVPTTRRADRGPAQSAARRALPRRGRRAAPRRRADPRRARTRSISRRSSRAARRRSSSARRSTISASARSCRRSSNGRRRRSRATATRASCTRPNRRSRVSCSRSRRTWTRSTATGSRSSASARAATRPG